MDRRKIIFTLLCLIISLALFLRVFNLGKSPQSVNWDEASFGYNALLLWQTGKDEYGVKLPLALKAFGEYKPALYAYLTAPFVGIFGLNEFTTRIVSALAGTLSVLMIFLLGRKISSKNSVGLLAAFLLAVEPWSIYYSRGAWEANLSLFFALLTIYLLACGKKFPALFVAGLNTFVYHSAKIYFLFTIIWLFYQFRREWRRQKAYLIGLALFVFLLALVNYTSGGLARLGTTAITSLWTAKTSFYEIAADLFNRYFSYFNPANLFVRGTNEPNQSLPGWAIFYPLEFVGWFFGLSWFWRERKRQAFWKILLLVAGLPAVITVSWFNPIRVLPFWAVNTIIIALGWSQIFAQFRSPLRKTAFSFFLLAYYLVFTAWFFVSFLWLLPYQHYGNWQWGFKEIVSAISPRLEKIDRVILDTNQAQPQIFIRFYLQGRYFDKFEFRKINWQTDSQLQNTILVGTFWSIPNEAKHQTIYDPQGYDSIRIYN